MERGRPPLGAFRRCPQGSAPASTMVFKMLQKNEGGNDMRGKRVTFLSRAGIKEVIFFESRRRNQRSLQISTNRNVTFESESRWKKSRWEKSHTAPPSQLPRKTRAMSKNAKKGIFGNPHRKYFQATQKFAKYATHIAIAGIDFTTKITKKT